MVAAVGFLSERCFLWEKKAAAKEEGKKVDWGNRYSVAFASGGGWCLKSY